MTSCFRSERFRWSSRPASWPASVHNQSDRSAPSGRSDPKTSTRTGQYLRRLGGASLLALVACTGSERGGGGPSNDLLVVGYDREPDTLNRFSTHILEDISTCVIEGLTTTDERMNIVPLLATEV